MSHQAADSPRPGILMCTTETAGSGAPGIVTSARTRARLAKSVAAAATAWRLALLVAWAPLALATEPLSSTTLASPPAAPAVSAAATPPAATRTIRYDGDRVVTVPHEVTRVASSWEAQNAVIAMLGFGSRIVATTRYARDMPAFRKLVPGIDQVPLAMAGPGLLNVEELMRLRPQVLFTPSPPAPAQAAQLQRAGIAVASFRTNSLAALVKRTRITGDILGGDAVHRAASYRAYFDANVARVRQALADLPASARVSVYHSVGSPMSTSGRPSLNQDWMDLAGVRNVAEDWFGPRRTATAAVSIEQIIAAEPDLIVARRAEDARLIRTDPRWRQLRAVRNGRVYNNPKGMFWWSRETSEVALQFLWLARLAYPEQMKDVDLREETRHFYRTFYRVELDDDEVDDFLIPRG